ncbi:hypothetical protein SSUR61_0437 [Streptococcus suis R61]|uniref:Uncharacterized protein n=1 Tax=Streptococcus suis R61 TaxID=996306 RepID=A0AA87FAD8_STRSU|nr:hypothetical protein SSUR61_0437 [Streptococcus suis R61]
MADHRRIRRHLPQSRDNHFRLFHILRYKGRGNQSKNRKSLQCANTQNDLSFLHRFQPVFNSFRSLLDWKTKN